MMKKNIIVIGAGLAGTLVCNELADKSNVTLLKQGREPHQVSRGNMHQQASCRREDILHRRRGDHQSLDTTD